LLLALDEPATFANLALLITFTLALVQALLSMIGAVISCLWAPCCLNSWSPYTPIVTNSHYVQTTPHRYEVGRDHGQSSSVLLSLERTISNIAQYSTTAFRFSSIHHCQWTFSTARFAVERLHDEEST
jgi:hypothetical protein